MDKEQARFILQSFRPDGADSQNPDFTEALKLATEDRELGEWLAKERAEDATFANALSSLPIPGDLREEILAVLAHDGVRLEEDGDDLFIGALASVKVPDNLRDQILSAMEVELSEREEDRVSRFPFFPMLGGLAAAVALSVSAYFLFSPQDRGKVAQNSSNIVNVMLNSKSVQMEMGLELQVSTDQINFEYTPQAGEGLKQVSSWLNDHNHPMPISVPKGLEDAQIIGSRPVILTTGHRASLVTFRREDLGDLHMIVLDAKTVEDLKHFDAFDKVGMRSCVTCPVSEFLVTRWKDSSNAYMLLSNAKAVQIRNIF